MSEPTFYDDPNRESLGLDPAWVEGTGGEGGGNASAPTLDEMTKAQLIEYAQSIGASPANSDMTKEQIRASIDAKLAEEPAAA